MTPGAKLLVRAFQAAEQVEQVAALLGEDGFDVETIRVLSAWQTTEQVWKAPGHRQPDKGSPTARAWAWLVAGWRFDYVAIADAANVSRHVARARMAVLIGNRLIYPTGELTKAARGALQASIAKHIRGKKKKAEKADDGGSN